MRILAHTRMGRPICVYSEVYSYGTPIRVWDNILSFYLHVLFLYRSLDTAGITVPINGHRRRKGLKVGGAEAPVVVTEHR